MFKKEANLTNSQGKRQPANADPKMTQTSALSDREGRHCHRHLHSLYRIFFPLNLVGIQQGQAGVLIRMGDCFRLII